MTRPLGASTFIWTSPMRDEELWLCGHLAQMGFDVIEICVETPGMLTAPAITKAAADAGLAVSVCGAFGPSRNISSEDETVRAQALDYLRHCIDLAAEVGSPHVAGPMYSATGLARPLPPHERLAERERAAEGLQVAAEYARRAGVTLAIEPLNRYETDMINTVEQGLSLCQAIGAPNVGLMLDTYHLNIEETSVGDAIRLAGDRCLHVQASENQRGIPGAGHVPWQEVKDALDDISYAGSIVIESFIPTIEEIARAVSLWRPVAPSSDELASTGRAFLASLEGGVA